MNLTEFFKQHPKIALGFSGGVDSSYLFYAAVKAGADIRAYYVHGPFQADFEYEDAKRVARDIGAEDRLTVIEADVLSHKEVTNNPWNRCYYCKNLVFGTITQMAADDGYTTIIDGTNASDDPSDRPGVKALQEMHVLSPLQLCGIFAAAFFGSIIFALKQLLGGFAPCAKVVFVKNHQIPVYGVQPFVFGLDIARFIAPEHVLK